MRIDILHAAMAVTVLNEKDYTTPTEQVSLETEYQKEQFDMWLDTLDGTGLKYKVIYWTEDGTQYYDNSNWT